MSITVRKTFQVSGTPTDVTSFKLGVVRSDNHAVVIASGTAMTRTAPGVYEYTFAEPEVGLSYTVTYEVVYGSNTTSWEETVSGSAEENIPVPVLTGDYLIDTLNWLQCQRLRVTVSGPKPSYRVHGQAVDWKEYLEYLSAEIQAVRRQIAQEHPFEIVSRG